MFANPDVSADPAQSSLPMALVRPKIGLPPSAWMPNPLERAEPLSPGALVAMPVPDNPWNAKFAAALLVMLVLVNLLFSAMFGHAEKGSAAPNPRLLVVQSDEEDVPRATPDTGVYRSGDSLLPEPVLLPDARPRFHFSPPGTRAALTSPDQYVSTRSAY